MLQAPGFHGSPLDPELWRDVIVPPWLKNTMNRLALPSAAQTAPWVASRNGSAMHRPVAVRRKFLRLNAARFMGSPLGLSQVQEGIARREVEDQVAQAAAALGRGRGRLDR